MAPKILISNNSYFRYKHEGMESFLASSLLSTYAKAFLLILNTTNRELESFLPMKFTYDQRLEVFTDDHNRNLSN